MHNHISVAVFVSRTGAVVRLPIGNGMIFDIKLKIANLFEIDIISMGVSAVNGPHEHQQDSRQQK